MVEFKDFGVLGRTKQTANQSLVFMMGDVQPTESNC